MLHPELLLQAYAAGIFPMAENPKADGVYWVDPPLRAILPLGEFHVPKRLARSVRGGVYNISVNRCFGQVIAACAAAPRPGQKTWINETIKTSYANLHQRGFAHSVEAWQGERLAGGLYGVCLGGAFFGESMFSAARDASKVALVHLAARLERRNFRLLDSQFMNPHMLQFGAVEIPRENYRLLLRGALREETSFGADEGFEAERAFAASFLQSRTQMS